MIKIDHYMDMTILWSLLRPYEICQITTCQELSKYVQTAQSDEFVPNLRTIFQKKIWYATLFRYKRRNRLRCNMFYNFSIFEQTLVYHFCKNFWYIFFNRKSSENSEFARTMLNHTASRAGSDCAWLVFVRNFFVFAC